MTAPAAALTITQRYMLKDMKLERSGAVPPGRIMLCKGRKVLRCSDLNELEHPKRLQLEGVNTVCVAGDDFDDVKRWIG